MRPPIARLGGGEGVITMALDAARGRAIVLAWPSGTLGTVDVSRAAAAAEPAPLLTELLDYPGRGGGEAAHPRSGTYRCVCRAVQRQLKCTPRSDASSGFELQASSASRWSEFLSAREADSWLDEQRLFIHDACDDVDVAGVGATGLGVRGQSNTMTEAALGATGCDVRASLRQRCTPQEHL